MHYSMIWNRHLRDFHADLPGQFAENYIKSALANREIRKTFKGLKGWKLNSELVPTKQTILKREPLELRAPSSALEDALLLNSQGAFKGYRKPLLMYEFRNICIMQNGGGYFLFNSDGISPYSTVLPNFRFSDIPNPVEMQELFYVGDRFSPENICHFTFDYIGRAILARSFVGFPEHLIAFPHFESGYSEFIRQEILPSSIKMGPASFYFVKRLRMFDQSIHRPEHPARHCDPRIIDTIRASLGAQDEPWTDNKRGERIYLNRLGEKRRPLSNESELISALEAQGIRSLNPGNLEPQEQLALFRNASLVISPHGAGLTSLINARPETSVIEFFTPSQGTLAYYQICSALGMRYSPIFGTTQDAVGGWKIDIETVLETISAYED